MSSPQQPPSWQHQPSQQHQPYPQHQQSWQGQSQQQHSYPQFQPSWQNPQAAYMPQGTQPGQSMGFGEAVKDYFRKYVQFSGRASRSQYWWPTLALSLVSLAVMLVIIVVLVLGSASAASSASYDSTGGSASAVGGGAAAFAALLYGLLALLGLATFLPSLAVLLRRLHDTDRSGWWYFISFVPFVGAFVLLYFTIQPSDPRGARFDD